MSCVVCGGSTSKVMESRVGRYRDEQVEVHSDFFRCEQCREEFFSADQVSAHNRAVKNEIRRKHGLLPPERIAAIRTKLGLSQAELEELLGTGARVVVRWESGRVIQGGGHDSILRLLESDPAVLDRLRQIQRLRSEEREAYRVNKSNPKGMVAQVV